jgi:hypothetical protein
MDPDAAALPSSVAVVGLLLAVGCVAASLRGVRGGPALAMFYPQLVSTWIPPWERPRGS